MRILFAVFALLISVTGNAEVPPLPPGLENVSVSIPSTSVPAMSATTAAPALVPLQHRRGTAFDLRFVSVAQVVDLVYRDALSVPYVLSPDVLADTRLVSFRLNDLSRDVHDVMHDFLDALGYAVKVRNGVDYVVKREEPSPSVDRKTFVYAPMYRSADYLIKLLAPAIRSRVSMSVPSMAQVDHPAPVSTAAPASSPSATIAPATLPGGANQEMAAADDLVFVGAARDLDAIKTLLPQIDTPAGQVIVRGWAYEVDDTDTGNSGFEVAAKLLGIGLSMSSGSAAADANAMQFSAGRLSFAISAMNADSRFKQVSSPNVRVVSGQSVKLNVGQQVPTVSSVSYQGTSGTPVQSIEYQDAGVIFQVQPVVLRDSIQLEIDEELSSFVSTTTGVSGSPTKNTRSLTTTANLHDGEVVLLGGLVQTGDSQSRSHERFLPRFLDGHSSSKTRTEVVLVLQVQRL